MTAKTNAARRHAGMDTAFNVLNGGFGKAYRLTGEELISPS